MAGETVRALRLDEVTATYFDGVTNRRHEVVVQLGMTLDIAENGSFLARWPLNALRRLDGAAGHLRLRCETAPELARLDIADAAFIARLADRARNLDLGRELARGSTLRIVLLSLAAAASIILTAVYGVPLLAAGITPLVPASAERVVGDAVENQVKAVFGDKTCTGAGGEAALAKLVSALEKQGGLDLSRAPGVLQSSIPNAFALPGGKVFVLSKLLDNAESPDELAGILAHELGHVAHRDGVRMLIQTGGTSFLIGLLFGDVTGSSVVIFAGKALLDARYTREAEFAADGFAIDVMNGLGRSARPMGEFLLRITGKQGDDALAMFASHPFSEDRLDRMSAADHGTPGPALLVEAEWQALKDICK